MSVYKAGTIKRRRRTRAEVQQLDQQLVDVISADHPQSIRHLFYRMTDPRLPEPVEKSDRGYRHVQDRLVKLRRSGRIPYGWISDSTRRGYHTPTYRGAGDFVRSMAAHYRADLWQDAGVYCEVWCESRSIAGVIQADCEDLAVSLYPAGGFSSITLAYEAAETINILAEEKQVVVFYVGDYDPAGVLIDVAIERELHGHLRPGIDLHFIRVGITAEQIARYDLPTKPRKAGDRRARHIQETVEAEALPANILRQLLRERIENLLPDNALSVTKVAEESEIQYLERWAEILDEGRA